MRNARRVVPMAIAALAALGPLAWTARAQDASPRVMELRLDGVVDPFVADYIEGGIRAAPGEGVDAVLLTIDTPGGLDSSMRQIIQAISTSTVPVICYVSPEGARAASAGTFIMMGCPVAAMAPGTNIGAAHPVGVAGAIEQQKVTNDAAAYIKGLAQAHGRNATWAVDAVVDSVSISANDALEMNVIDLIAPDTPTLLNELDGRTVQVAGGHEVVLHTAGAAVEPRDMGLGASILHTLLSPDFAFLFFYLGLGLIVVELLHPGLSVPGILGVLSLAFAFVTFGLLPVQILGVALLLASALFFLLELKHPGLSVASVGGVVTLILGGLTLFNPSVPNARVSIWLILPVATLLALFFATVVPAALRVRRLPPSGGAEGMVGREGVVQTDLEPDGVVLVASEEWSARSTAGPLPRGTPVRVVAADRLTLTVEPTEREASAVSEPEGGNA